VGRWSARSGCRPRRTSPRGESGRRPPRRAAV